MEGVVGGGRTLGGTSRARSGMCRSPMTSIRKVMAAVAVRSSRRRVGHERSTEGLDAAGRELSARSVLVRR